MLTADAGSDGLIVVRLLQWRLALLFMLFTPYTNYWSTYL